MTKVLQWLKIERSDLSKPSVIILILANLVPLGGAIFLGWQVFPLMLLFWIENVIVGFFNVLKMLSCKQGKLSAKLTATIFFCFHYGMFTLVHGLFVVFMFGGWVDDDSFFPNPSGVARAAGGYEILWGVLALFISHAISFGINYVGKGEYKNKTINGLMGEPYTRVIILHVTIIIGAFFTMLLGSPIGGLIILIGIKTFVDIQAHLKQHNRIFSTQVKSTTSTDS